MSSLKNIPQKLKRKFVHHGINSVEDLQNRYYELVNSKGFGGIFVAVLQKYIKDENIDIPKPVANQNISEKKIIFSLNPPPPALLKTALVSNDIYTIDNLKQKYRDILSSIGFGENRIISLISYMRELNLTEEANDIQINYLQILDKLKLDYSRQEKSLITLDIISEKINILINSDRTNFVYPVFVPLSTIFSKENIRNFADLKNNFSCIKKILFGKKKAIKQLNMWLDDTICFHQSHIQPATFNYFPQIQTIFSSFFSSLNSKDKYICKHYFENLENNYMEIAKELNLSRERVRQICNKYRTSISSYILGATIGSCNKIKNDIARQLFILKSSIESANFLTIIDVIKILSPSDLHINPDRTKTIHQLCKIWNFEYISIHPSETIIITHSPNLRNDITNLSSEIFDFFQNQIYPLSLKELHIQIQQKRSHFIEFSFFEKLANTLEFLEKRDDQYSLKLRYYSKYEDMAALILYNEKKPLKSQDIKNKINIILASQNATTYTGRIANTFSNRLAPLGKTGFWALKEHIDEFDSKTLKEKIIDTFKQFNRPLSIKDLRKSIKGNYAENSCSTILNMGKGDVFLPLSHGRYILAEWKPLYENEIKTTSRRKKTETFLKSETLSQKITASFIEYFNNKQSLEEPLIEIVNFIKKIDGFETPSIYKAISNNPLFTKINIGRNKLLHYNKSSEDIMSEILSKKRISELISKLLQKSDPNCTITGNNPFRICFDNKHFNVYIKNITDTDALAKVRGNYRVQLPYRTEFEEMKHSPIPFIFLGFNAEFKSFASWKSSIIKSKLNTKSNVSLYPRIIQMESARKNQSFETLSVSGEGEIISFPCEFLPDFLRNTSFNDQKTTDQSFAEENYEAEYEQNGLLLKITNPKLISRLQPVLSTRETNRFEAYQIIWDFYGDRYPHMKLSHWGKLIDRLCNELKKK